MRPSTAPSDGELVARTRDGDRWAAEVLFRRHYAAVTGTVVRLLGDSPEADDVAQDAMESAFADISDLREPGAFRAWLVQIAVRKVHRRFRRRRLRRVLGLESGEPVGGMAVLAADGVSPEARAELQLLDRTLATLPAKERVAWTLRMVEGLKLTEVAAACDCSLATAKRRIAAADGEIRTHVSIEPEETG